MDIEEKQGQQLLELLRIKKSYTISTLDGHKLLIKEDIPLYNRLQDQIDILSQEIGGRAKTRIRKECNKLRISTPNFKLEGYDK